MLGAVAPSAVGAEAAVVAHEYHDGVVGLAGLVEPVEDVAEALVHTLHERSVGSLFGRIAAVDIRLVETHVAVYRHMHRIVAHVEKPRGAVVAGSVKFLKSLLSESFGDKRAAAPVFFQTLYGEARCAASVLVVAIVLFRQISRQAAVGAACHIDVKSPVVGIFAGGAGRAEMEFADMDGVIAGVAELVDKRRPDVGAGNARHALDPVDVPLRRHDRVVGAYAVGGFVARVCPVSHAVTGCIGSCEEAASRRRADRACIGLGELHSRGRKAFHRWSVEGAVVGGGVGAEWH